MITLDSWFHAGPIGDLRIVMVAGTLVVLDFADNEWRTHSLLKKRYILYKLRDAPPCKNIQKSLDAYFAGKLDVFREIKMDPAGTPFQRTVWHALKRIPAGQTLSYKSLANEIGRLLAARAIGSANAGNPISIMIPCHRVITRNGQLSGYAGGINRQRWLLQHEGVII